MISDRFAKPGFVETIAAATMKFSVIARLNNVKKDEIMNDRNRTEDICKERPTRCAR